MIFLQVLKDTVNDAASLNVSVLGKVELDKLPKATGVIVVHGLSVPEGLHDGTADRGNNLLGTVSLNILRLSITVCFDQDVSMHSQYFLVCYV